MRVGRVLAAAALVLCSGCYTLRADLPGALRHDVDASVEVIGSVDVEVTHTFFLGGLLRDPPRDLFEEELLAAVDKAGGDGVANMVFETRFSAANIVVNSATVGVVSPRTYRLRADIVRIRRPALPGRPLLGREQASTTAGGSP